MIKKITEKQLKTLGYVYEMIQTSGFPPTMAELRDKLDVVSNQSVLNFLKALEEGGFIEKSEDRARGLRILPKGFGALGKQPLVPQLGISSCGPFIDDPENFGNWQELPRDVAVAQMDLVKESSDNVFVIQVFGDSMINAGIADGDLLLIKKENSFRSGDIVVARSDDGTTVKRLIHEDKRIYLKPENPEYKNIPFYPDTYLDGKVIANLSAMKRLYEPKIDQQSAE